MKKTYGDKTIERLRENGYSARAIEDITYLAHKHNARVGKIEEFLSQGYNPAQTDEIYGAARKFNQSPQKIQIFYDRFKPEQGKLAEMISQVVDKLHDEDLHFSEILSFLVHQSYKYEGDFTETLDNLVINYYNARWLDRTDRLNRKSANAN